MTRRAFTLIELLTVVLVVASLAAILIVSSRGTRRTAQLNESINNLKNIAARTSSYHADNADRFWTFTWSGGVVPNSTFADLRAQAQGGDDFAAGAAQAVDIIRRRAPGGTNFPVTTNWIPHLGYSHLVLADYAAESLPVWDAVSPAHASLITLARNPFGTGLVRQGFASSYELGPAFHSTDRADGTNPGLRQATTHNTYQTNGSFIGVMGRRTLAEVAFPSQKAFMWDAAQRHFSVNPIYFAIQQARPIILAVDGHASVRNIAKCNQGFQPSSPRSTSPTVYSYQPGASDPPIPGGGSSTSVNGYLRWTRGGLQGRDFDGREIDTSNW